MFLSARLFKLWVAGLMVVAVLLGAGVNAPPVRRVEAASPAGWQALTGATGTGTNGAVYGLALDSSRRLYVGGSFVTAGGITVNSIARWDGADWSGFTGPSATGLSAGGNVKGVALDSANQLYIVGGFGSVGGLPTANRGNGAKWNGSAWVWPDSTAPYNILSAAGNAVTVDSANRAYFAGTFVLAGDATNDNGISRYDDSTVTFTSLQDAATLGIGLSPQAGYAIVLDGSNNVYVGGGFTSAGNVASTARIARYNGTNWLPLGAGIDNGQVNALALDANGNLYAGGTFTTVNGGTAAAGIARWNGSTWSALGSGVSGGGVNALAFDSQGNLYVGGSFTGAGGVANTGRLAIWNGITWQALTGGVPDNTVNALAYDAVNGYLYVGGIFTSAGTPSVTVNNVARYSQASVVIPGANGGNGPGGVGITDGSSNLTLWLRADMGVYSDAGCTTAAASSVGCWRDQSGHNRVYTQTVSGSQPGYYTGAQNSQPVIRFDGTSDYLANRGTAGAVLAAGDDTFTYFASWKAAALQSTVIFEQNNNTPVTGRRAALMARAPSTGRYGFNGEGNDFDVTAASYAASVYNVSAVVLNGGASNNVLVTGNGASVTGTINITTEDVSTSGGTAVGYKITLNNEYFNGDIPEVIAYTDALPAVERILVENYLSAKYNIALSATDVYTGDTDGDFDLDVAGIGRYSGGNHTQSHSAGLIVVNRTFLQDNGDWLTFGHLTVTNSKTTADVPTTGEWATASNPMRWARHWYFNRTDAAGATGGTVDLIFDFSEGGMGGQSPAGPASNYRLLKRTGTTGQFSDIAIASAIVGDQVQFLGVDVALLGSNFTLGSLDNTVSPTAVIVRDLTAQSSAPTPWLVAGLIGLALAIGGLINQRRQTRDA